MTNISGSVRDVSTDSELMAGWRDVIEVDGCEQEMIKQLEAVMSSVPGSRDGKKWINIQGTDTNSVWVYIVLPRLLMCHNDK